MTMQRQPPWDEEVNALELPARFSPHEQWAWARIIRGATAEMNRYPGPRAAASDFATWLAGRDDGAGVDANKVAPGDGSTLRPWPQHRTLSKDFLLTVLFERQFCEVRLRPWVRIEAATINDAVEWQDESFDGALALTSCRFEKHVNWSGLRIGRTFEVNDSRFAGELLADLLVVNDSLLLRRGVFKGGSVRLRRARVGGDVEFNQASFEGPLSADGISVANALQIQDVKPLKAAHLIGARIGQVQLSGSKIEGPINFTGAEIAGELRLSQGHNIRPEWGAQAKLLLRNAKVGVLAGGFDAFPKARSDNSAPMELSGLSYLRLGGYGAGRAGSLAESSARELKAWLSAGHEPRVFTPAPYQQLATALTDAGHADKANAILHEMRRHERNCERLGLRKLLLDLSGRFIGFGYRNDYALRWFCLLVVGFAAYGLNAEHVLQPHAWRSFMPTSAGAAELFRWLGFSFGNAIPVVSLDKAHETFLAAQFGTSNPTVGYDPASVPVLIAWVFYLQKLLGFVILSYLAAGLTGLARRGQT